jgi:hypothetical protein
MNRWVDRYKAFRVSGFERSVPERKAMAGPMRDARDQRERFALSVP